MSQPPWMALVLSIAMQAQITGCCSQSPGRKLILPTQNKIVFGGTADSQERLNKDFLHVVISRVGCPTTPKY